MSLRRTTWKLCSGGDKMRNASGHQCKVKMSGSEKKVNENTYDISFKKPRKPGNSRLHQANTSMCNLVRKTIVIYAIKCFRHGVKMWFPIFLWNVTQLFHKSHWEVSVRKKPNFLLQYFRGENLNRGECWSIIFSNIKKRQHLQQTHKHVANAGTKSRVPWHIFSFLLHLKHPLLYEDRLLDNMHFLKTRGSVLLFEETYVLYYLVEIVNL